jgi:hypothetical protein
VGCNSIEFVIDMTPNCRTWGNKWFQAIMISHYSIMFHKRFVAKCMPTRFLSATNAPCSFEHVFL